MKCLLLLLLVLTCVSPAPKRLEVIWLNNGGQIMSYSSDWIKVTFNTPNLKSSIVCTDGNGYIFNPGTTKRFYNLWMPVQSYLSITIQQYNYFSKNDAAYIQSSINPNTVGYYQFTLSLSEFRNGATLSLEFKGVNLSLGVNSYTATADYYMLLQLVNTTVANQSYGLQSSCYLKGQFLLWMNTLLMGLLVLANM